MKFLTPKELQMSYTEQNISLAKKIIIPWASEDGKFKNAVGKIKLITKKMP